VASNGQYYYNDRQSAISHLASAYCQCLAAAKPAISYQYRLNGLIEKAYYNEITAKAGESSCGQWRIIGVSGVISININQRSIVTDCVIIVASCVSIKQCVAVTVWLFVQWLINMYHGGLWPASRSRIIVMAWRIKRIQWLISVANVMAMAK